MPKIFGIWVTTELARASLLVMLRKSWVGHGNSLPLPGHSCHLAYLEIIGNQGIGVNHE